MEPTTPQSTPETSPETVPQTWPGAFGAYKYAKAAAKVNLGGLIVLYVLFWLLLAWTSYMDSEKGAKVDSSNGVSNMLTWLMAILYLAGIQGKKVVGLDVVRIFLKDLVWLKLVANAIVVGVMLFVSFVLLVVPFLFLLPRVLFTTYFIIEKKSGPIEAIKQSMALSKGHAGKIYGIIGATIAMLLPAFTIIGIPVALYLITMYGGALAVLYTYLLRQYEAGAIDIQASDTPQQ